MIKHLLFAALFFIGVYGFMEAWPLMYGPNLAIASPEDGASFEGGVVTIAGNAARAAQLTLNGATLLHDQNGDFSSTLTFPRGGSILTFVAIDRFGRTVTATRSILVP